MRLKIFAPLAACGLAAALATAAVVNQPVTPDAQRATEANITRVTTRLLERSQFSHHPLDKELAARFLDRYLDTLDDERVLFLQSDLDGFGAYRARLAQATRRKGDTRAAQAIFARYLERLAQRAAYVTNALQTENFDFHGNDTYSYDRENAARPRDLAGARGLWMGQLRAEYLQEKLGGKKPGEIVKVINRRYAQLSRNMRELSQDEVLEVYLNALARVYDPHSDYMGREQMENFAIAMNLQLFGVGATLQSEDGSCVIRDLVPGGPAARSGQLKPGDRIVAVAQAGQEPVDVVNMPMGRAVELIRGAKGSVVRLTVIPAGAAAESARETVTLVRDEINLEDQEAKARIVDLPGAHGQSLRLGVIDLPSFYADTGEKRGGSHHSASADVARLLRKLQAESVRGVILDLRHNGGGSLEEAINLTGLFARKGPVVQTRGPDGDIEIDADSGSAVRYDGPLIVLTSRYSASASEIVAGALQDYGRALVVGDTSTFGKGTVQTILSLAPIMDQNRLGHAYNPGALKVTIRKFYRPSGASTQLKGVASDIVLPSLSGVSGVSESALKDPLPWDTVPSADYQHLNEVRPYLEALREQSARRIAGEKEFALLREDIARVRKSVERKSVSLNEAERRQEMAETKARRAEYERESRAARTTAIATYEITLKNANLSGLPAPMSPAKAAETTQEGDSREIEETPDTKAAPALPARDIILTETERILADYAGLLGGKAGTAITARY